MNGKSIDDSIRTFENTAKVALQRRSTLNLPLLSRIYKIIRNRSEYLRLFLCHSDWDKDRAAVVTVQKP